jgi:hypothetical protein
MMTSGARIPELKLEMRGKDCEEGINKTKRKTDD